MEPLPPPHPDPHPSLPPLSLFLRVQWFECGFHTWPSPTSISRTPPSQLQPGGLGTKILGGQRAIVTPCAHPQLCPLAWSPLPFGSQDRAWATSAWAGDSMGQRHMPQGTHNTYPLCMALQPLGDGKEEPRG